MATGQVQENSIRNTCLRGWIGRVAGCGATTPSSITYAVDVGAQLYGKLRLVRFCKCSPATVNLLVAAAPICAAGLCSGPGGEIRKIPGRHAYRDADDRCLGRSAMCTKDKCLNIFRCAVDYRFYTAVMAVSYPAGNMKLPRFECQVVPIAYPLNDTGDSQVPGKHEMKQ